MRSRFSHGEPAHAAHVVAPVVRPRQVLSQDEPAQWPASVASAILHAGIVALLLLLPHGPKRGDVEDSAPAFAMQFDTGQSADQPPAQNSEPRVSVTGDDEPPPAPEAPPHPTPLPQQAPTVLPPMRFGTALAAKNNPFAHVVPFDLSQNRQGRRSLVPPGSRGLDLSAGPVVENGGLHESVEHVRGNHGNDDYIGEIVAFAEAHKYYPRQAAENGEQGAATLLITVRRDGTIKHLSWVTRSGSVLLDAAWFSVFHDNKLPPMNDDMPGQEYTFQFTLNYELLYGAGR